MMILTCSACFTVITPGSSSYFFCPRAGVLEGGPHGGKCKSIAAITIRTAIATALRSDCTDEEQPQARKGKLVRHFYAAQDSAKMAG
jgi:hypothetical protein